MRSGFVVAVLSMNGVLLLVTPSAIATAPPTGCVVDGISRNPSFAAFRKDLLRIIHERNAQQMLAVTDPDVRLGEGENHGMAAVIAALKRNYYPVNPISTIWRDLEETLSLGAYVPDWDTNSAYAPSLRCDKASVNDDAHTTGCVIGTNVAVHEAPSVTSPVLRRLSCQQVMVVAPEDLHLPEPLRADGKWTPVVVDGRWRYIAAQYVRFAGGSTGFTRKNGKWWWMGISWPD